MIFIHKNCQHLFEFYLKKSYYIYDFLNKECNLEFYQSILHLRMHKLKYFSCDLQFYIMDTLNDSYLNSYFCYILIIIYTEFKILFISQIIKLFIF